jgi:hypothetical protein
MSSHISHASFDVNTTWHHVGLGLGQNSDIFCKCKLVTPMMTKNSITTIFLGIVLTNQTWVLVHMANMILLQKKNSNG